MNSESRITKRVGGDGLKSLPTVGNDGMNRHAWRALSGTLMPVLLSLLLIVNTGGVAGTRQAQAATGTLGGAVSAAGPEGQAYNVPVASLKLTGTARVAEALANDAGVYEFAGLPPGAYTLEVDAQGFKTASSAILWQA